jgi:hypothetical protein
MDSLTELFCLIDDFCQGFEPAWGNDCSQMGRRSGGGPHR